MDRKSHYNYVVQITYSTVSTVLAPLLLLSAFYEIEYSVNISEILNIKYKVDERFTLMFSWIT